MKRSPQTEKEALGSNLTELLKPFHSGWVALSSDEQRVVASGEALRAVREQALDRCVPVALFVKVIPPGQGYL
jgi:hypothetical protein